MQTRCALSCAMSLMMGTLLADVSANVQGRRCHQGSNVPYRAWAAKGLTGSAAVYVLLELSGDKGPLRETLEKMMADGTIPSGLVICTTPGVQYPTQSDGKTQYMRAMEYDRIGRDFTDFLIEDLIPHAAIKTGVTVDPSPERHFIAGCSSGGLAAWNAVWYRNDWFRRAFLSSPTFSAMAGGEEPMVLARKCETRPIRVFMTAGTCEPEYYFGDSYFAAMNAAGALKFAGYDCRFEVFPHEGHGARREDPALWKRMMPYLFADWKKNAAVKTLGNPPRVKALLAENSKWEECSFRMPAPQCEAKSVDGWRVFTVSPNERGLVSEAVKADGTRCNRTCMSPLHLAWNSTMVGGSAVVTLADGRLLVATELGVQGVLPFGITDLILPLPGDLPADNLTVVGTTLYVSSGTRVFRRELKVAAADPAKKVKPTVPEYWDGQMMCPEHQPASRTGSSALPGLAKGKCPNDNAKEPPTAEKLSTGAAAYWYPATEGNRGAFVVVCPGGGYGTTCMTYEGWALAEWFNSIGVGAVVLDYHTTGGTQRHAAPLGDLPLREVQETIRLVRQRAAKLGADPKKVGVMGFSAGGHLAATALTRFTAETRPDFGILCYAVTDFSLKPTGAVAWTRNNLLGENAAAEIVGKYSCAQQVTKDTPPVFILSTGGDTTVPSEHSVKFYLACRRAGVPAEMHVWQLGKHGGGLCRDRAGEDRWPELCETWLCNIGVLGKR